MSGLSRSALGPGAEFDLIRRFLAGSGAAPPAAGDAVRVGPGDDCAVLAGDGIALSVDMSMEGVHFTRDWLDAEEIGYRATAAALSDLAAVAATPIGVLVSLALPAQEAAALGPALMTGCRTAAADRGAILLGGDLTRSPGPVVVDVVVVGSAAQPVLRTGAGPGDVVWVTGRLGAPAAALRAWRLGLVPDAAARAAFARPHPRTAEAAWLAERGLPTAMIDLSDGLAGDAGHLAAASGVQIVLAADAVPIHPAAAAADDALAVALGGGEDYELCFTAADGAVERVHGDFVQAFGVQLTRVGYVSAGEGVMIRDVDGTVRTLTIRGFDHLHDEAP